jgi:hypothetical protein
VVVPSQTKAPLSSNCPLFFGGWLRLSHDNLWGVLSFAHLANGGTLLIWIVPLPICPSAQFEWSRTNRHSPSKKARIQPNFVGIKLLMLYDTVVNKTPLLVSLPASFPSLAHFQISLNSLIATDTKSASPISLSCSLSPLSSLAPFHSSPIL